MYMYKVGVIELAGLADRSAQSALLFQRAYLQHKLEFIHSEITPLATLLHWSLTAGLLDV